MFLTRATLPVGGVDGAFGPGAKGNAASFGVPSGAVDVGDVTEAGRVVVAVGMAAVGIAAAETGFNFFVPAGIGGGSGTVQRGGLLSPTAVIG